MLGATMINHEAIARGLSYLDILIILHLAIDVRAKNQTVPVTREELINKIPTLMHKFACEGFQRTH